MNQNTKIFIPLIFVSSAVFVIFQFRDKIFTSSKSNLDNSDKINQNQTDKNVIPTNLQKLIVLTNRCIGCGKCMKIDPSHFEIINNKSSVISSANLDSSTLRLAINNCPVQAIVLE
jgi:ferredoxin